MARQKRLLAMLGAGLPAGANPVLPSGMGWRYRHQWWRDRLKELSVHQSMGRKGDCLDNAATEQVLGHLKDEFHAGRTSDSFRSQLGAYIVHRNTKRRQEKLEGHTPDGFRSMPPRPRDTIPNKPSSNKRGAVQILHP